MGFPTNVARQLSKKQNIFLFLFSHISAIVNQTQIDLTLHFAIITKL